MTTAALHQAHSAQPAQPAQPAPTQAAPSAQTPSSAHPGLSGRRHYDAEYDPVAIKRANPIAEHVRRRYGVDLRPVGRALRGLCPLHVDVHTPNLYVYPDRNPENDSFSCYRCNVAGDVITLVMTADGLTYPEACEQLGGVRVPTPSARRIAHTARTTPAAPLGAAPQGETAALPALASSARRVAAAPAQRRWDCLSLDEQVVMNVAGVIYRRALWANERVLAYLRDRGIPDWATRACALGYADGHSLEAFLRRRSGLRVAQELGLLRRPSRVLHGPAGARSVGGAGSTAGTSGDEPLREFFAGRIVVPEIRAGQTMWFIGRLLDGGQGGQGGPGRRPSPGYPEPPKYLALPGERPVLGYERVAGRREAFLCEGVFDYLTAVSWGLPACSPCGTYVAPERLGFLARATAVYGVFDGDDAGREATERAGEHLGARWRPIALPDGCDLNDLGQQPQGRTSFFSLLAGVREATDGRRGSNGAVVAAPVSPAGETKDTRARQRPQKGQDHALRD